MLALLREPSSRLDACEITHVARVPIDVSRARKEHATYAACLRELGVDVRFLPPLPEHADGVFVEDMAVILPEMAIIARPGVASRRGEIASVVTELEQHRLCRPLAEGQLDGGDVMVVGRTLYVGISGRTNEAALASLTAMLTPQGYRVVGVPVRGCLHLKTAATFVPPDILVMNPAWLDAGRIPLARPIAIDPREPFAANTLTVGTTTLVTSGSPRTAEKLRAAGVKVEAVDIRELQKAEAGLTCLSLLCENR